MADDEFVTLRTHSGRGREESESGTHMGVLYKQLRRVQRMALASVDGVSRAAFDRHALAPASCVPESVLVDEVEPAAPLGLDDTSRAFDRSKTLHAAARPLFISVRSVEVTRGESDNEHECLLKVERTDRARTTWVKMQLMRPEDEQRRLFSVFSGHDCVDVDAYLRADVVAIGDDLLRAATDRDDPASVRTYVRPNHDVLHEETVFRIGTSCFVNQPTSRSTCALDVPFMPTTTSACFSGLLRPDALFDVAYYDESQTLRAAVATVVSDAWKSDTDGVSVERLVLRVHATPTLPASADFAKPRELQLDRPLRAQPYDAKDLLDPRRVVRFRGPRVELGGKACEHGGRTAAMVARRRLLRAERAFKASDAGFKVRSVDERTVVLERQGVVRVRGVPPRALLGIEAGSTLAAVDERTLVFEAADPRRGATQRRPNPCFGLTDAQTRGDERVLRFGVDSLRTGNVRWDDVVRERPPLLHASQVNELYVWTFACVRDSDGVVCLEFVDDDGAATPLYLRIRRDDAADALLVCNFRVHPDAGVRAYVRAHGHPFDIVGGAPLDIDRHLRAAAGGGKKTLPSVGDGGLVFEARAADGRRSASQRPRPIVESDDEQLMAYGLAHEPDALATLQAHLDDECGHGRFVVRANASHSMVKHGADAAEGLRASPDGFVFEQLIHVDSNGRLRSSKGDRPPLRPSDEMTDHGLEGVTDVTSPPVATFALEADGTYVRQDALPRRGSSALPFECIRLGDAHFIVCPAPFATVQAKCSPSAAFGGLERHQAQIQKELRVTGLERAVLIEWCKRCAQVTWCRNDGDDRPLRAQVIVQRYPCVVVPDARVDLDDAYDFALVDGELTMAFPRPGMDARIPTLPILSEYTATSIDAPPNATDCVVRSVECGDDGMCAAVCDDGTPRDARAAAILARCPDRIVQAQASKSGKTYRVHDPEEGSLREYAYAVDDSGAVHYAVDDGFEIATAAAATARGYDVPVLHARTENGVVKTKYTLDGKELHSAHARHDRPLFRLHTAETDCYVINLQKARREHGQHLRAVIRARHTNKKALQAWWNDLVLLIMLQPSSRLGPRVIHIDPELATDEVVEAAVQSVAWAAEMSARTVPVDTDADARCLHAIFKRAHRPRFANPMHERRVLGRLAVRGDGAS